MVCRIEIGLKSDVPDSRGLNVLEKANSSLNLSIDSCCTRDVYKIDADLSNQEIDKVVTGFTDCVVAESALDRLDMHETFNWCIEISYKAGVTDNVGRTARGALQDILERNIKWEEQVYTSIQYFISGDLKRKEAKKLGANLLANKLIHNINVYNENEWRSSEPDKTIPMFHNEFKIEIKVIELPDNDDELMRISNDGILSLSLEEMRAIRSHYLEPSVQSHRKSLGLNIWPTDVELECIAQTWSEHCSHKIFAGTVKYKNSENGTEKVIKSLYKTFIKSSTNKIAESIDWLVSVFTDNAGIVKFDDKLNLVYKVETHNSPSALDPYGGSMTGIVGVNRDPLGTGIGAELISNVWGYCLGSPFYEDKIPDGLMHPRRIRDGVHEGVIDGGNQSGIPYSRGFEYFDHRFIGKPLVYCGTLGTIPVSIGSRPSERKEVEVGDWVVMCGGRIGKDGIHGATFSSEELRTESPAQAVQIGDPLTQRKLYEFILEARDLGLFRCITDNGAGGISCSFGEMGKYSNGCDCELHGAPLKYEGLQPWEILVSEAQERMTLAVQPENRSEFETLALKRDVDVAFMGKFNDSGYFTVKYKGDVVASLDMDFLYENGCPVLQIPAVWKKPIIDEPDKLDYDYSDVILSLVGDLNLCSREFKSRMYDGEVKGLSVVKPYVGKNADVPSDATVLRVDYDSNRGAVLAEGINPWFSDIDSYCMTTSVIDEAVRKIISVGGELDRIAILDNYCWPDPVLSEKTPDGEYKMAQLVRSCEALYDLTTLYKTPAISGKDSCKNDSTRGGVKISIPPTLLISSVGQIKDVRKAVTMHFKTEGDLIYVIGKTKDELGASAYHRWLAEKNGNPQSFGGKVPEVDGEYALLTYTAMNKATNLGILNSATTPSKGGVVLSLVLAAIGGECGVNVKLSDLHQDESVALFSESNSRFIISISPNNKKVFEEVFKDIEFYEIGLVNSSNKLKINSIEILIEKLTESFKKTLDRV